MTRNVYCVGSIKGNQTVMDIAVNNTDKSIPAKRINIVSLKMVKESSILYKERKISSPADAYNLIKEILDCADREYFVVCSLDIKNQPTTISIVSIGTLNSSLVHPREVFKSAILSNAASIIIAHNHPSGDCTPSNEDIGVTTRLNEAGKIIGIDLIDHIIIGSENKYCSLKEKRVL